jgi:hypothetical protein
VAAVGVAAALWFAVPAAAAALQPGSPEYVDRDNQNMRDAYGRQLAPGGQLDNPNYLPALMEDGNEVGFAQLGQQLAVPYRIAITPGQFFPGWNVGNPLRRGWSGTRGQRIPVSWTNRYGALVHGNVFAPLPGAKDPYTGAALKPPYPGVVITEGSVQATERMYFWLAEDLAERGYEVLTYDVQGQGTSESLPHQGEVDAFPFCNPFAPPKDAESFGCPGVPAQQASNFVYGTQDALSFFLSTPAARYPNPAGSDYPVNSFNPLWELFDRSPDRRTATPGRTTRIAIVGHSLGAFAVSYVQGVDKRVEAVVALDKLQSHGVTNISDLPDSKPVVPALAVQSEYGFNVQPYWMASDSSFASSPGSMSAEPPPNREEKTGFDAWRKAGVDTMLVVPRASTHLEYSDIPLALPASRYGQDLTSVYVQAWLDRYLKHAGQPAPAVRRHRTTRRRHVRRVRHRARRAALADPLLGTSFRYLEPVGLGKWEPVTLQRDKLLSFYFCSGYAIPRLGTRARLVNLDLGGIGGCR